MRGLKLKKVQDASLKGKKILLRVGFNVSLKDGNVREKFKIQAAKDTIDYILSQDNVKLALVTHLGRPGGKFNEKFSLKQIVDDIEKILGINIEFIKDCVGDEVRQKLECLENGKLLLLENVRFYPGEASNDKKFAEKLAENFDVFVNDSFSVCHRNQASVTGVAGFLSSFAGIRLQKEVKNLEKVKNNPERPAIAAIGGAKIETKLPLIRSFEKSYNYVLTGGKIASEAMDRKMKFSNKVILALDFAEDKRDIGEKTIAKFEEIISRAKTIVWNGPMGEFEVPPFDKGTKKILEAIIESGAFSVVGGGESVQVLEENNLLDKISFVSTGGGAMLEYLSGEKMPGLEVLADSGNASDISYNSLNVSN